MIARQLTSGFDIGTDGFVERISLGTDSLEHRVHAAFTKPIGSLHAITLFRTEIQLRHPPTPIVATIARTVSIEMDLA
jgi:hypothetical protein